jgi:hypothetical protein
MGVAFVADGLASVTAEGVGLSVVTLLAGGLLAVASTYTILTGDPDDFSIPAWAAFAIVVGAIFAVLGVALDLLL